MAPTIISSVVAAPTALFAGGGIYDLIDLATVKSLLGITTTDQDPNLKTLITQVSDGIKRYCNRTFQGELVQDQLWPQRDPYPWQVPGGVMPLQLSRWPVMGAPCTARTNAPLAAALSFAPAGALALANYFVRITYVTATGETPVSAESNLIVAAYNVLHVASPAIDPLDLATGWNVYVGTAAGSETLQNVSPVVIGAGWIEPTSGLIAGTAMPTLISVIENPATPSIVPTNLIEGIDFVTDFAAGQITRLDMTGYPRVWAALPYLNFFRSGFSAIPPNIQDACVRLVRGAYFALKRDPMIRSENIEGVYEAQYWFGNGPGGMVGYPPDVQDLLDRHRVPVIA